MKFERIYIVNNPLVAFIVSRDIEMTINKKSLLVIETRRFSDHVFKYNCKKIRLKESYFVRLYPYFKFFLRHISIEELVVPWLFNVPWNILNSCTVRAISYVEEGTLTWTVKEASVAISLREAQLGRHKFSQDYLRLLCFLSPSDSLNSPNIYYYPNNIFKLDGYRVKSKDGDRIGLFPAPHRIPESELFSSLKDFAVNCDLSYIKLHPVYNNSGSLRKRIEDWFSINPKVNMAPWDMLIESECFVNQITVVGHQSSLALVVEKLGSKFEQYKFKNYIK